MICINWDGFPQYAARCVRVLVDALPQEKVIVVAYRPTVPIEGMESICGCPVVWIDANENRGIAEICGEMPKYLSVSGWFSPLYNKWRDEVRRSGGIVVCGCDNNYLLDHLSWANVGTVVREILKAIRFRLRYRSKYDGYFVPGRSARKLLNFYGVPDKCIVEGAYAADASLFSDGRALVDREKRIIYVGQFIERKNVRRLVMAFKQIAESFPDWTLDLYGSGPLKAELVSLANQIPTHQIVVHDFVQPEQLADLYRSARVFILPSLWEHWGLVVHEAALSGCVLLLGNRTGAAADLLGKVNGQTFNPYSEHDIAHSLRWAMSLTNDQLADVQNENRELSRTVSIERFVEGVRKLSGC